MDSIFDIVIIGGGINGCGIAADAAMRGLKTLLIEKDDLASKTSSSSTKLIHGGLRYLEQYDFSLVRKALTERQILMHVAPHLIHPLPIILPCNPQGRPAWLIRTGLFIYDHINRNNTLPRSQRIKRLKTAPLFDPLLTEFEQGFMFYECMTDDAQLTISNALQAKKYGAEIKTHTVLLEGQWHKPRWELTVQSKQNQTPTTIQARVVINAAGPWVDNVNYRLGLPIKTPVALVQGSHLVVPKLYDGDHGYLLQHHQDKRVIFVLPYHGQTMIGTTEVRLTAPAEHIAISSEETQYLLQVMHHYFKKIIQLDDVISSWSGIRPLIDHGPHFFNHPFHMSRDYCLQFSYQPSPALIVYGGKITTYRQLAADAIDRLKPLFPGLNPSQTDSTPLPGSLTSPGMNYEATIQQLKDRYDWLDMTIFNRLIANYGSRIDKILCDFKQVSELGQPFGHGLYQAEVDYLIDQEWATTAEDILWRRTKLGLIFNPQETKLLTTYLSKR